MFRGTNIFHLFADIVMVASLADFLGGACATVWHFGVVALEAEKTSAMNAPLPPSPPITEVPDYVWSPRYGRPAWLPGRPVKKPVDTGRRISHPNAESALKAAKKACLGHPGRWFGRSSDGKEKAVFLVYEDGKVVERHVVQEMPGQGRA